MMAAPSRNGVWDGFSASSQNSFQRPLTLPHVSSFNLMSCATNDEGLETGSSDQQSLFAAASTFVSAVTAMDKHVMVPNKLRDHRLPGSSQQQQQQHITGSAPQPGERSRHGSGQSLSTGSLAGCTSLSSDCTDPLGALENGALVNDELTDTDMYSCYRLLNKIKSELLSSANEGVSDGPTGGDSGDSDSEHRPSTPKDECVMFSAGPLSTAQDTAASVLSPPSLDTDPQNNPDSGNSSTSEPLSSHRTTSASTSVTVSSTDAIRQRFRIHLHGLMSILSQLTETANMMTNYYDKCLIPGANATTTLPTGGLNHPGSFSAQAPPTAFNMSPLNGQSHSNGSGDPASHIFQPTRLF